MKLFKVLAAIGSLALFAFMLTPASRAQSLVWNKKTTMTFSAPFEIPGGQVLSAGTYVFKLVDSPSNRNIVQISSEDEKQIYATVLAISNERLKATENTVVTFKERASGSPQAIKAWFHPDATFGHEFVYPKPRAMELARIENEPVPSMPAEVAPTVAALEAAPVVAEEPTGKEIPIREAFAPTPTLQAAALPKTASSLPLVGLIGLLSLTAAFTLLMVSKKIG